MLNCGLTMTNTASVYKIKHLQSKSRGKNLTMASVIIGLRIVFYIQVHYQAIISYLE